MVFDNIYFFQHFVSYFNTYSNCKNMAFSDLTQSSFRPNVVQINFFTPQTKP